MSVPQAQDPFDAEQAIATNPGLRDAVRAATKRGLSPSRFLGRPVVTTHELDEHGRLTRTVIDPDWTDEDRALAIAFDRWDAGRCPGCRGRVEETTDPGHEDGYVVDVVRCHACTAIAVEAPGYQKNPHPSALMFSARLREDQPDDPAVDAG